LLTELPLARQLAVWETTTGKKLTTVTRPDTIGEFPTIHFSPDGKWLALAVASGRVDVWNAVTGRPQGSNAAPRHGVLGVGFPGDGSVMVCGRQAQTIQVWQVPGEAPPPQAGHLGVVTAIRFSPDGKEILTAGSDYRVVRWDGATGKLKEVVFDPPASLTRRYDRLEAEHSLFTPDGKWCVACLDRGFLLIDVAARDATGRLSAKSVYPLWNNMAVSTDSTKLFAAGSAYSDGTEGVTACVWDIKQRRLLDQKFFPKMKPADKNEAAEKYFKDKYPNEYPAAANGDNAALTLGRMHIDPVTSMGSIGWHVSLKDPRSGKILFDQDTGCAGRNSWAVSPDGKRLALGWNDSTVLFFDLPATTK
jgi:WD40 repeat protein